MSKENKTKKIFRVEKDKNFSVIKNTIFLDERLSWGAKGVLAYALTKPDDWDLYISEVVKRGTDKKEKVSRFFKELRQAGYFEYRRIYEAGKICRTEYIISEQAKHSNSINIISRYKAKKALEAEKLKPEFLIQEKLGIEILSIEKTPLINTDSLLNTDNNKILKEQSEKLSTSKFIEYKNRLRSIDEKFNLSYLESSKANQYYEQAQVKYDVLNIDKSFTEFFESILTKLEKLTSQKLDRFAFKQGFTIESLVKFDLQGCAKVEAWFNEVYPQNNKTKILPAIHEPSVKKQLTDADLMKAIKYV